MGLLDSIKSALGDSAAGNPNDMMSAIMNLVGGQKGDLNGFIQQFSSKGLGDLVSSWVGTGKNLPISAEQIQHVLGSDTVKNLASKMGIDTNSAASQLSNLLPQVIDKLTPNGKVPEGDILSQGMNLLRELFGKK
jgi:uncharacterized protein YidB (DUF937 family)